jgi:imidazolonepropionase-like amidohydrolase
MRRLLILLASLLASIACSADVVVFRDANVLSMASADVKKATVIVRDGKIAEIRAKAGKLPKGARVIDARGKFLMPGLAEMHGHVPPLNAPEGAVEDALFLYVANGITTVRGMLGHDGQLGLRESQKRGQLVAPNLYLAGPSFNGNSINSVDDAIAKVRAQKNEGWDLLKVHPGLTLAEYDAMARAAREVGIRFGGHVPQEVGLLHAIEAGQETFDHIDGYAEFLHADQPELEAARLADIVTRSKAAGVWIVPTSALWEVLMNVTPLQKLTAYPELKYVSAKTVETWSNAYRQREDPSSETARRNIARNRGRILRALHDGGVRILMGTDAPQQFSVPGFSLHRELLVMRDAGLSPYAILHSGTVNVGHYFAKQDSFGTIESGKRADLVLLHANPLLDIANVSTIDGVMVRGRWLSRADLDAGLAKIEAKHKR